MSKDKKKNKVSVRQLVNQYQTNCERINAIADLCEQPGGNRVHKPSARKSAAANAYAVRYQCRPGGRA